MQLLKFLEQEYPIIDADFQQFCASHNIFSVDDFLVHDLYVLASLAEHHAAAKELKQGITQVLSIIDNLHLPWMNGVDLLEDAEENKHVLPTGCEGIDVLLHGGLREGQLTELVGPSSSGKTQVCLHAASHVALNCKGAVMFFDTCNSFSSKRIADIISCHLSSSKEVNRKALSGVMSSILCHSVFDIYSLLDGLQQLELKLGAQVENEYMRTRLLIVDSVSSLIVPVLGGGGPQGHSLMVSVGFLLKKLANEHNLSVLVTNHMVSGEGGMTRPALGESWKTVPHVRLLLSRDHGSNFYSVSVLKHTCMLHWFLCLNLEAEHCRTCRKLLVRLEGLPYDAGADFWTDAQTLEQYKGLVLFLSRIHTEISGHIERILFCSDYRHIAFLLLVFALWGIVFTPLLEKNLPAE